MFRRILIVAGLASLALVLAAGYLYWIAKQAEPHYAGTLKLTGLGAPVSVRYGPHAVPTIRATDLHDLLFAQGFVVASERMWQMDLMRRLAGGRLAELMGAKALKADIFFRTLGLGASARRDYAALEAPYRRMLEAYAAGVNAYRTQSRRHPPLEYRLAGLKPSPWNPEDSLAIGAYMAWILSFNVREELVFLRLAERLGNARAAELFPTDEGIPAPAPAPELPRITGNYAAALAHLAAVPARFGLPAPGAASNAWAINGSRTADGGALLANDPHLAAAVPNTWYELELIAPGLHAAGVALPGLPLVVIGHNRDLAWGFTTTMADTQDLFLERALPDGVHVQRPNGQREPIHRRLEQIPVAGRRTPVAWVVRRTSNGVVLNDVLGPATDTPMDLPSLDTDYLVTLRRVDDIPDRSIAALHALNTASDIPAARRAMRDFRQASQNLMLAHRDGGIGWQVSGRLPQRRRGLGTFPSPGWSTAYGWDGYVDAAANPGRTDPPDEALVTANQRTIPIDHPVHVGRCWMPPYRARRIEELLATDRPLAPTDLAEMQMDRVSLQARHYQRAITRLAPRLRRIDPEAWRIAADLLDWDAAMRPDSRPAAIAALLEPALYRALFGDELGQELPLLMGLNTSSYDPLHEAVSSGRSSFWDDVTTAQPEGPAEIWARALRAAAAEADGRRLEQIRTLTFPHAFDRIPLLGRLFSIGPLGVGGDSYTVNVAKASPNAPRETLFVPSMRVVYTPQHWDQTRGVLPLGQSGHLFSPYRRDQLEDWQQGRYHDWPWHGPEPADTIGTLRLEPREGPMDANDTHS